MEQLNSKPRFSGPITAETNDDDLQYLANRNGYALGVPVQITRHLLALERHILQLQQKIERLQAEREPISC